MHNTINTATIIHADSSENTSTPSREMTVIAQPLAKKLPEAVIAYQKLTSLAESGNLEAQFNLGVMHELGKGALKDFKESVKWYKQASDQGYALAQAKLANLYFLHGGVSKDYAEIYILCNLAVAQGIETAIGLRDVAEKYMTRDQIEKAQERSREMWQKLMY
jgi:TPR repeat protein